MWKYFNFDLSPTLKYVSIKVLQTRYSVNLVWPSYSNEAIQKWKTSKEKQVCEINYSYTFFWHTKMNLWLSVKFSTSWLSQSKILCWDEQSLSVACLFQTRNSQSNSNSFKIFKINPLFLMNFEKNSEIYARKPWFLFF